MAFIPIPNSVKLCFNFLTDTSVWQFCITVKKDSGSPTEADLEALAADAGHAWWTSDLKALTGTATSLDNVQATDQTSESAPEFVEEVGEAGTLTGSSLPSGTPMCITFRTAKRGRSYRGRNYVSGRVVPEMTSPNTWLNSATAAIISAYGELFTLVNALGYTVVVPSKQHNNVVSNPATTEPVTSVTADNSVDSQRRRLAGRGI